MQTNDKIEEFLSHSGLRHTKQRRAVLTLLYGADTPLTADDIFLKLREQKKPVCLATVYRILDQFSGKGLVTKHTPTGQNSVHYEIAGLHHQHQLRCVHCNEAVPIPDCPLEYLEEQLHQKTSYVIKGHKLEIFGLCPKCQ